MCQSLHLHIAFTTAIGAATVKNAMVEYNSPPSTRKKAHGFVFQPSAAYVCIYTMPISSRSGTVITAS